MKKIKTTLFIACCFTIAYAQAQNNCKVALKKAEYYLNGKTPFKNTAKALELLEPCALNGNAKAENYLGMMYLNGVGVKQNNAKAFTYFNSAAQRGFGVSQYNLARMYKYGIGCELDFKQAITWFTKAAAKGNEKAKYSLGYMFYKGYGVNQDYTNAVQWFQQSEYPMAKHFLGLCYYFGYGVTANEEKALEILLNNPIVNSKTMVNYISEGQREKIATSVANELENDTSNNSYEPIPKEVVEQMSENITFEDSLGQDELIGEWNGKIVQYDWSGEHILRIIPIEISIDEEKANLIIDTLIEEQQYTTKAQWQYEHLYLNKLQLTLDKLFSDNPKELTLDYILLSIGLQKHNMAETTYLIGNVDSYIPTWSEYGKPMSIVLKPKNAITNEDEEMLLALAAQKDQFIKLYPVPFKNQLTIQYQLETAGDVYVEVVNYNGYTSLEVTPKVWQEAGDYTYTVNSQLPEGIYIVRIIVGDQLYTRMVIKEN